MARLFFLLSHWPLTVLHPIGAALGWITYALSPTYRRRLVAHAKLAGLSRRQRWSAVAHAGRMVAEMPHLWGRPRDELLGPRVQWHDAQVVDAALQEDRGLLLLTPHIGCFEICAQAYAERYGERQPMTALYRPAKQAWLAQVMEHARHRAFLNAAPATLGGVRQLLRALKQGETIGLLPDQVPPHGMGVWSTFFGRKAYTMTMAAKLAHQSNAVIVLLRGERLNGAQRRRLGTEFVVHAYPAPPELKAAIATGDPAQSASAINRAMEALIMQCPEQYLWGYNRYKHPRADILTSAKGGNGSAPS